MMTRIFADKELDRVLLFSIKLAGACDVEEARLKMAPDGRWEVTVHATKALTQG